VTKKVEQICLAEHGGMLYALRCHLKLPSRRRSTRKERISTEIRNRDWTDPQTISLSADQFPALTLGLNLPVAGIALGIEPTNVISRDISLAINQRAKNLPPDRFIRGFRIHTAEFLRLIAKIGYAFAVAERGVSEDFLPMVRDVILGKTENSPYLVGGGWHGDQNETAPYDHSLDIRDIQIRDRVFTLSQIHLFGRLGAPKYHVVVRERPVDSGTRIN